MIVLRWLRELDTLQIALALSLSVHGALLAVRFVDPERFDRAFRDTPLEVILVNSRSGEKPPKGKEQAIAQASLAGGGDAEKGRARSPLPPSAQIEIGEADEEQRRRLEQLQEVQQQLLAQLRRELALMPPPDPRQDTGAPQHREVDEKQRQLIELLAEIEKRVNASNARPKRRFISPATREESYALYYDSARRRIEDRGTRNFPEHNGRKLYGELVMNFIIDARGRVVDTEVIQPSHSKILDRRAAAIVRAAAPYGPFSARMLAEADELVITAKFKFNRDDGLEAEFVGPR
jgi:protein TonB